jgi:hypothetical protein
MADNAYISNENQALTKVLADNTVKLAAARAAARGGGDIPINPTPAVTPAATPAATPATPAATPATIPPINPTANTDKDLKIANLEEMITYLQNYNTNTRVDNAQILSIQSQLDTLKKQYQACKDENYTLKQNALQMKGGAKRKSSKRRIITEKTKELRAIKRKIKSVEKKHKDTLENEGGYRGKLNFMEIALKFKKMISAKGDK